MMIDDYVLMKIALLRRNWFCRADPVVSQERFLLNLVRNNVQTVFGKEHDFLSIHKTHDFLQRVKPRTYNDLSDSINAVFDGARDILFPGYPECFALTSGTNGIPKRIPLTKYLLRSTQRGAIDAALFGGLQHGSMSWYRGKTLYLGPRKEYILGSWTLFAEGTAFAYLQPFTGRFVPQYEDLPEHGEAPDYWFFADLARRHKIYAVAGNPIEISNFVNLTGIVLSEVSLVFNCGYWAFDNQHIIKSAFPNATIVDVYGSNEGTFGLPWSPGEFLLNYARNFFTFVPVENELECMTINQVELYRKYRICVTTPGGLWNYITGDVVSFNSFRPPLIRLHGRDCRILALNGDWLTEDVIVGAVRKSQIFTSKYFLTTMSQDKSLYESEQPHTSGFKLWIEAGEVNANIVDRNLCALSPAYARLRDSNQLAPLTVQQISNWVPTHGKPARIRSDLIDEA